jgi:asparagine synthase (glutamine-hydrolysing)
VLDGRVDAVLRSRRGSSLDGSALALLHESVERDGPSTLNDFAAEFALVVVRAGSGETLLARDAFALHPLYVAGWGRRFAYASDPVALINLGLATGELDVPFVAAYLARREPSDGRTAFRDVRELLPGTWLCFDAQGRRREGRWFDPERLRGPRLRPSEAVDATREAVTAAVVSRTAGQRVGISLSGGRDSGSVAIAAARAGIDATGITQTFDPDLPVSEEHLARALCERYGLAWLPAPVPSCPSPGALEAVPRWSGTPLSYFAFPQATSVVDSAATAEIDVVLTGEGGEPLFTATDVAVLDLLRTGHLPSAWRASRMFRSAWGGSYVKQLKVAGKAIAPRSLLLLRESVRPVPPWLRGRVPRSVTADAPQRSDRQSLLTALRDAPPAGYDLQERLFQTRGVIPAYPLLDLRVVSVALSLGLRERAPIQHPKPMLAAAFLGELAESRVKMSFEPYYKRLARQMHRAYPDVFSQDSLACRYGLLEPAGLASIDDDHFLIESLGIAVVEMWLRATV